MRNQEQYTLRDALIELRDVDGIAIDDGSSTWYPETLLSEGFHGNEGDLQLETPCKLGKKGIYLVKDDGSLESIPSYQVLTGEWSKDGEFIAD